MSDRGYALWLSPDSRCNGFVRGNIRAELDRHAGVHGPFASLVIPSMVVRGFDLRDHRLCWSFDGVPRPMEVSGQHFGVSGIG